MNIKHFKGKELLINIKSILLRNVWWRVLTLLLVQLHCNYILRYCRYNYNKQNIFFSLKKIKISLVLFHKYKLIKYQRFNFFKYLYSFLKYTIIQAYYKKKQSTLN